jgi:hypothetical protein
MRMFIQLFFLSIVLAKYIMQPSLNVLVALVVVCGLLFLTYVWSN